MKKIVNKLFYKLGYSPTDIFAEMIMEAIDESYTTKEEITVAEKGLRISIKVRNDWS